MPPERKDKAGKPGDCPRHLKKNRYICYNAVTMLKFILRKIFGTQNERDLKRLQPLVSRINACEPDLLQAERRSAARQNGRIQKKGAGRRGDWMSFCPKRLPWCAKRPAAP